MITKLNVLSCMVWVDGWVGLKWSTTYSRILKNERQNRNPNDNQENSR